MNVLIVGAGPAGVATGYLLARAGHGVRLVEREPDFERVFRGEGLMPSGVDALRQMGLGELLDSLPCRVLEAWDLFIEGRPIFSVPEPYEALGEMAMRVIPQAQFLEAVVNKSREFPNFGCDLGVAFRDVVRKDGRVCGAVVERDGAREEIAADLVIGCDGRASLVRSRAEIALELIPQSFDVLWFKLPAPEHLREHCRMLLMATSTTAGACYTSWDGKLQYALMIPKGVKTPPDDTRWAEALGTVAPDWLATHVMGVEDQLEGPVRLKVIIGRCGEWGVPGLLLLGDAAHPMSPVRAQGINVALRDAIVAANHLAPLAADADANAIDAAARAIQAEREPEIVRAQNLQYQDTRFWGTRLAPFFVGLARTIGPVMGKYAWAQRAWRNQQRDLWFGSREVRLRV